MKSTFIIAEAGVNHNGDLKTAKKLISAAAAAGVDAVKFQTFQADKVVSRFAPKAEYQKATTGCGETQLEMARKLELSAHDFKILADCCRKSRVVFISSPFDLESIDLLASLGVRTFKIPSGEITNLPYLRKIGALGKKIILSTGMSTLKEVGCALEALISAGTRKRDITVLQCNTQYPTPYEDANIRAMVRIKEAFAVDVGYSDHTPGIEVPMAAVALGASVIEKHFTLDKDMPGPDHRASLDTAELAAMVRAIRNVERALGTGNKIPSASESANKPVARKSIVAARDIKSGEVFTDENITVKRPGTGISPMKWGRVIGRRARKDFNQDEMITL